MFLKNKNTVTLLAALVAIVVLYVGYNMRVKGAVDPVKVPYAKVAIQPKQEITKDMIGYMDVAKAGLKGDVILDVNKLIGYYSAVNTLIPEGSMFYKKAIIPKNELPDSSLYDVPKGETLYYLQVNMLNTYSNSILPGNFIDIYAQTITTDVDGKSKVMLGKLLQNVKVLAVKTSNGLNVFENSDEQRVPAVIIFAVKEDVHLLLRKAAIIGSIREEYKIDIIPVPTNTAFPGTGVNPGDITTNVTSTYIKEFIEDKSIYIPEDELGLNTDTDTDTNKNNDNTDNNDNNNNNDNSGVR